MPDDLEGGIFLACLTIALEVVHSEKLAVASVALIPPRGRDPGQHFRLHLCRPGLCDSTRRFAARR